jgi:hypothetical protein
LRSSINRCLILLRVTSCLRNQVALRQWHLARHRSLSLANQVLYTFSEHKLFLLTDSRSTPHVTSQFAIFLLKAFLLVFEVLDEFLQLDLLPLKMVFFKLPIGAFFLD